MKRIFFILSLVLAVSVSCKKEEETPESVPNLEGRLRLRSEDPEVVATKLPEFVLNEDLYVFRAYGVSVPASDREHKVSYCYYLSNDKSEVDTSDLWYVHIPADTLGKLTLYGYAFAPGYSMKSITSRTTIINPALDGTGSLTGYDIRPDDEFLPVGDDMRYYYIEAGGNVWMRQNWGEGPLGKPCADCEATSRLFGRYFTWDEAREACPAHWKLASDSDFENLLEEWPDTGDLMADVYLNGERMWEYWPSVGVTGLSRLDFIPSGYAVAMDDRYDYRGRNSYSVFWTADSDPDNDGNAIVRYIYEDRAELVRGSMNKSSFAASVRCVRDDS